MAVSRRLRRDFVRSQVWGRNRDPSSRQQRRMCGQGYNCRSYVETSPTRPAHLTTSGRWPVPYPGSSKSDGVPAWRFVLLDLNGSASGGQQCIARTPHPGLRGAISLPVRHRIAAEGDHPVMVLRCFTGLIDGHATITPDRAAERVPPCYGRPE